MSLVAFITILLMALSTFAIRSAGYLLLRNRHLPAKIQRIMEAAPGCVLLTVIAPHFATTNPADLLALAISIIAACRFQLLPVVVISVLSTAILRAIWM